MDFAPLLADHGLLLTTFTVCAFGAVVPLVNSELYFLFIASVAPSTLLAPAVLLGAFGQMLGKVALCYVGQYAPRLVPAKSVARLERVRTRFDGTAQQQRALVFVSALSGLPSLYVISLAAGVMRMDVTAFFAFGLAGRVLRFAAIVAFPHLIREIIK